MGEDRYKRPRQRRRSIGPFQSGQALSEFALVIPIVIVILAGLVDVSRILMVQHVISDTSRDAARVAALGSKSSTEVKAQVISDLERSGLDATKASIGIAGVNAGTGEPAIVLIAYPVESVILELFGIDSGIMLTSTSRMVHE